MRSRRPGDNGWRGRGRLRYGGYKLDLPFCPDARRVDGVDNRMKVAQEEIFGPVLAVIAFDGVEDAVAQANDVLYGLAAGVWTRDVKKAHTVARRLQAGTVWVNAYNFYDAAIPFGGYKASGFGRDLGPDCLRDYTQVKSVWVNLE